MEGNDKHFINGRKAMLLVYKWKAKGSTFMEERGLLTKKGEEKRKKEVNARGRGGGKVLIS